jgi:hypothetical protein
MKRLIVLSALMAITAYSFGQDKKTEVKKAMFNKSKYSTYAGLGGFVGCANGVNALYGIDKHVLKNRKLLLGGGLRLSYISTNSVLYTTAAAKYTGDNKTIDSLWFGAGSHGTANIFVNIGYTIIPKLQVGFNIEALGASFGGKRTGSFADSGAVLTVVHPAKPTAANVLLVGDNDLGSLVSNFYVQYKVLPNFSARIGSGYQFSEYTTQANSQVISAGVYNNRFRNKAQGFTFGVQYHF